MQYLEEIYCSQCLHYREEKKRNNKSSPYLMNFVPFKLQTKRKEKKEVINLNKMEEEERELINLINSTWEEMALLQSGAERRRREEGAQPFPAACSSFPADTWGQVGLGQGV